MVEFLFIGGVTGLISLLTASYLLDRFNKKQMRVWTQAGLNASTVVLLVTLAFVFGISLLKVTQVSLETLKHGHYASPVNTCDPNVITDNYRPCQMNYDMLESVKSLPEMKRYTETLKAWSETGLLDLPGQGYDDMLQAKQAFFDKAKAVGNVEQLNSAEMSAVNYKTLSSALKNPKLWLAALAVMMGLTVAISLLSVGILVITGKVVGAKVSSGSLASLAYAGTGWISMVVSLAICLSWLSSLMRATAAGF